MLDQLEDEGRFAREFGPHRSAQANQFERAYDAFDSRLLFNDTLPLPDASASAIGFAFCDRTRFGLRDISCFDNQSCGAPGAP